jgi:GT2 family glycosyltransferase
MKIAVLLTVFNRVDKTIQCLDSLFQSVVNQENMVIDVFITDDGSTDNTEEQIKRLFPYPNIHILKGDGNLYWNGGMINSWKAALKKGGYDGYLWLNNDTTLHHCLWDELVEADKYSRSRFGQGGIYVGSTTDKDKTKQTYGGFNFEGKWVLRQRFVYPDRISFQNCQCAHGNITCISHDVVKREGIFYEKYIHSGADHDYTYQAYKHGQPLFVMRKYVGICENDHRGNGMADFIDMSLKERIKYMKSPTGLNLQNILLFQKRNFPYRYPIIWITGYLKTLFPKYYLKTYCV